jgi:hypothetical protein
MITAPMRPMFLVERNHGVTTKYEESDGLDEPES